MSISSKLVQLTLAFAIGCGGGGGNELMRPDSGAESYAVVGRVDEAGPAAGLRPSALEGATVNAFEVLPDGSLMPISIDSAQTDADGAYTLAIDASAAGEILVQAEMAGTTAGEALFEVAFGSDGQATAPPINTESTVMADIYMIVRNAADWNTDLGPDAVYWFNSPAMLEELANEADYESAIAAAAEATTAAAAAWELALEQQGMTPVESDVIITNLRDAAQQLAGDLDAATTDAATNAAFYAYIEATFAAQRDAGVAIIETFVATLAAAEAQLAYAGEFAGSTAAQMQSHAALLVADAAAAVVETQALLDAKQQAAVEGAAMALDASIRAAADAGASAQADIAAAWQTYKSEIDTQLNGATAATVATLTALRLVVDGAVVTLESALANLAASASAGTNAITSASAVVTFVASVTATSNHGTLTAAGVAASEATAVLQILASVYGSAQ